MRNIQKFELEFPMNVSPQLLYQYISTPAGLAQWFADDVNSFGDTFTFTWEDSQEKATLLRKKADECVKFRWEQKPKTTFFEMKIVVDDLTQDISLFITDFALENEDITDAKLLWENVITDLKHILGSY